MTGSDIGSSGAFSVEPITSADAALLGEMTTAWNSACGPSLAVPESFVAYNTQLATGARQSGLVARQSGRLVGFVLASALPDDPATSPPDVGWIDAVAVVLAARSRGIGSELLAWAEGWLRAQGCAWARLGGSLHPFAPGYPIELGNLRFFQERGYTARASNGSVWDMARDLVDYAPRYPSLSSVQIRPMENEDRDKVLAFFRREFPERWRFEFEEFLRVRGRVSDYMLLLTERYVDGFARLTFEDSERPIDRFYLNEFPHPWGQIGPIGVSKDIRGKGYGGMLLDRCLLHLHSRGIRGCVIDWTHLTSLYGKFGFHPHREYLMLQKNL